MWSDDHGGGDAVFSSARGQYVSPLRIFFNLVGCALVIPCYYLTTMCSRYPVTLDILITVALAELNRFVNERRRMLFYREQEEPSADEINGWEKSDVELQRAAPGLNCMAAVVGWREDPALFTRALESYKFASSCAFLLVGIDGDETEDQEMVNVFNKVCPADTVCTVAGH